MTKKIFCKVRQLLHQEYMSGQNHLINSLEYSRRLYISQCEIWTNFPDFLFHLYNKCTNKGSL